MLARIRHRRRAQYELRGASVQGADAPQPTDDVGHVRPEDPAVDVALVDDDVAEPGEEAFPRRVVGEDAEVQHVGVGDDDLTGAAYLGPVAGLRVAVVRRAAERRVHAAAKLAELAQLVLGQRLGGEEIERPRAPRPQQALQHRDVIAKALPARGGGGDDHVAALAERLDGPRLVFVERQEPQRFEMRFQDAGERIG